MNRLALQPPLHQGVGRLGGFAGFGGLGIEVQRSIKPGPGVHPISLDLGVVDVQGVLQRFGLFQHQRAEGRSCKVISQHLVLSTKTAIFAEVLQTDMGSNPRLSKEERQQTLI